MCGGASKITVRSLNLPFGVENRLIDNGLETAQSLIDEGRQGLRVIGISGTDITAISEVVHQETGQWVD